MRPPSGHVPEGGRCHSCRFCKHPLQLFYALLEFLRHNSALLLEISGAPPLQLLQFIPQLFTLSRCFFLLPLPLILSFSSCSILSRCRYRFPWPPAIGWYLLLTPADEMRQAVAFVLPRLALQLLAPAEAFKQRLCLICTDVQFGSGERRPFLPTRTRIRECV